MKCAREEAYSHEESPPRKAKKVPSFGGSPPQDPFTPKKSYALGRSPSSGRIRVDITPNGKKALKDGTALYRFKKIGEGDATDEKRLIGVSDQPDGRLRSYIWAFNHSEEEGSQLAREVSESPEDFEFGLIRRLSPDEDPKIAETEAIEAKSSIRGGYNRRKGGGGGRARRGVPEQETKYSLDDVVQMIKEDYNSPQFRAFKRIGGRLVSVLEESDKNKKDVIYEFLFDPTGKKEDRIHHVGFTTTELRKRMAGHMSSLNNPKSRGARTMSVYSEILAHPKDVKVRVFNIEELKKKGVPAWQLEQAFMEYFSSERGEQVRNLGAGGKGSVSHASV